jgi:hypothetical protein
MVIYSQADLSDPDEREAFYATGSDRAVAILFGAVIENRLTDVIRSKFVQGFDPDLPKNLLRPSGAIGSFGTKNQIAYLFGFTSEFLFREIAIVVKIRNAFAHSLDVKDFSSQKITHLVSNLRTNGAVRSVTAHNPPRTRHVSGIEFGASLLGDYRLCIAYYISLLRALEKGASATAANGVNFSYFDS